MKYEANQTAGGAITAVLVYAIPLACMNLFPTLASPVYIIPQYSMMSKLVDDLIHSSANITCIEVKLNTLMYTAL